MIGRFFLLFNLRDDILIGVIKSVSVADVRAHQIFNQAWVRVLHGQL